MLKICLVLVAIMMSGFSAHAEGDGSVATEAQLNDTQVTQILVTLNEGEIDAAKKAKSNAKNAEVKGFAEMMKEQHEKNKDATKKLAKRQSIKMNDSVVNDNLKKESEYGIKTLKDADKNVFDKVYMDQQVAVHEKALKVFDKHLIPSAKNVELKNHLEKTREHVQAHLENAKAIQSKL